MPERPPSEAVIRAWTRLVRAQQAVLAAVEADLESGGFPPLGWYDVLLELSRADGGELHRSPSSSSCCWRSTISPG